MRETFIEIDSKRLKHNWEVFKIKASAGILVNLKANAYGIGAYETGRFFERQGADYFSVAYINEGVALRQKDITTNLLVFNPSFDEFAPLIDYRLEPEVSSLAYLKTLITFLSTKKIKNFPIHLKIDTGMHRAGIEFFELGKLLQLLKQTDSVLVKSVFSHLAAAEDPGEDEFTHRQIQNFEQITHKLEQNLPVKFFRHLLNTAGAFRFPQAQYEMIRPGLGLFGYTLINADRDKLKPVLQLKTKINQIKNLKSGESVGYNRVFTAQKATKVGLLPLGYADGIDRRLGNTQYFVKCRGYSAPIIGNVSMDTISIDLTGTPCEQGDEVIVIDNEQDVYKMADLLGTIPYEIIAGLSIRLPRVLI